MIFSWDRYTRTSGTALETKAMSCLTFPPCEIEEGAKKLSNQDNNLMQYF